ncbi:hypothetical protein ACFS6H_14665 [Terrimonas rubra]|uniref:Uncharacterized protein n=1 Tax=Terrimonas rubra TaxID=1035890 RepID=A0ABW6A745_9BACT
MKRNVIYATAVALLMNAVAFAQETPPVKEENPTTTQTKTVEVPQNYRPKSAELLPMPAAITNEAIFPAIGVYELKDKDGNAAHVTVTQDADNKGIVWIEGLPQGKIKAFLKQSPAVYKIPAQEPVKDMVAEEAVVEEAPKAKKQKTTAPKANLLPEGTLYYDRDNNIMQIQLGTKFNEAEPLQVFNTTDEAAATTEEAEVTAKKSKTTKAKVKKAPVAKTWLYTGAKATTQETVETAPATASE